MKLSRDVRSCCSKVNVTEEIGFGPMGCGVPLGDGVV